MDLSVLRSKEKWGWSITVGGFASVELQRAGVLLHSICNCLYTCRVLLVLGVRTGYLIHATIPLTRTADPTWWVKQWWINDNGLHMIRLRPGCACEAREGLGLNVFLCGGIWKTAGSSRGEVDNVFVPRLQQTQQNDKDSVRGASRCAPAGAAKSTAGKG